jgi:hypothetical protein
MGRIVSSRSIEGFGLVPFTLPSGAAATRNAPREEGRRTAAAPARNAAAVRQIGSGSGPARLVLTGGAPQISSIFPPARNYPDTPDGLIARFNDFATFVRTERTKSATFMATYAPVITQAFAALAAYNNNPNQITLATVTNLRSALVRLNDTVRPLTAAREFVRAIPPVIQGLTNATQYLAADRPIPRAIVDDLVDISSVAAGLRQLNETVMANQSQPIANAIRQFCSNLPG